MSKADMESAFKALLSTPQGIKVAENMNKLKDFVQSTEGKTLIQQLGGAGGDALKAAAQAAATGDKDAAARLVSTLMSTPDGARLALTLMNLLR